MFFICKHVLFWSINYLSLQAPIRLVSQIKLCNAKTPQHVNFISNPVRKETTIFIKESYQETKTVLSPLIKTEALLMTTTANGAI